MRKGYSIAFSLILALLVTIANHSTALAMQPGETYDQWLRRKAAEEEWASQRRQAKFIDLVKRPGGILCEDGIAWIRNANRLPEPTGGDVFSPQTQAHGLPAHE